ncbi:MAG: 5'/3'-nucleotidase SurE [Anaerolineae bacterium]|nr:5'/3'-nucleotidase SurE [Anaerolineae bacterium]
MHILVTNDDGVWAPGIYALQAALRTLPDVRLTIVAPAENQSAVGHRKTLHNPMRIDPVTLNGGVEAFACSGSPADAIALALMGFVKEPVDLVVSGINQGPNLAQDITYSGTVTAAMEAVLYGIPAIAFLIDSWQEPIFDIAAKFARQFVPFVMSRELPELTLLNVNVPVGEIKGVQVTRQGRRRYHDELVERIDPGGRPYYWIGGEAPTGDTDEVGTDVWAVAQGCLSITPIRLDMTAHRFLESMQSWPIDQWTFSS